MWPASRASSLPRVSHRLDRSGRTGEPEATGLGDEEFDDLELIELDAEQIAGGGRPPREGSVSKGSTAEHQADRGG